MPLSENQKQTLKNQLLELAPLPIDPIALKQFAQHFVTSVNQLIPTIEDLTKFIQVLIQPRKYFQLESSGIALYLHEVQTHLKMEMLFALLEQAQKINSPVEEVAIKPELLFKNGSRMEDPERFFPIKVNLTKVCALPETQGKCYYQEFKIVQHPQDPTHLFASVEIEFEGEAPKTLFIQTIPEFYTKKTADDFGNFLKQSAITTAKKYVTGKLKTELKRPLRLIDQDFLKSPAKSLLHLVEYRYYRQLVAKRKLNHRMLGHLTPRQLNTLANVEIISLLRKGVLTINQAKRLTAAQFSFLTDPHINDFLHLGIATLPEILNLSPSQNTVLESHLYGTLFLERKIEWVQFLQLNDKQCEFLLQPGVIELFCEKKCNLMDIYNLNEVTISYINSHPLFRSGIASNLINIKTLTNCSEAFLHETHLTMFAKRIEQIFMAKREDESISHLVTEIEEIQGDTTCFYKELVTAIERIIDNLQIDSYDDAEEDEDRKLDSYLEKYERDFGDTDEDFPSSPDIDIEIGNYNVSSSNTDTDIGERLLQCINKAFKNEENDWQQTLYDLIEIGKDNKQTTSKIRFFTAGTNRFKKIETIQDVCDNLALLTPLTRINLTLSPLTPT